MGYPAANRTAQWFADTYHGASMGPVEKVVWHTTEVNGWPGYDGGAKAPHYTVRSDYGSRTMLWRQHFPDSVNARAMRNEPGGIETNLDGALQVEIVGTCDERPDAPSWTRKPGVLRSWDLEDWQVEGLALFVAWAYRQHGVPLTAPSLWLAYGTDDRTPGRVPASYGNSPARMTGGTWDRFRGHCGHQHAPENVHGDPGRLPVSQILARAHLMLAPTIDPEDDNMTPPEFLKLLNETVLPLGEANSDLLGQPDGNIKYGELLVATAGHSAATNRLLAETNNLLEKLIALHTPPAP